MNLTLTTSATDAALVGELFTEFQEQTQRRRSYASVYELANALNPIRDRNSVEEWKRIIQDVVRPHPMMSVFLQDPMANRCFHKPRGYAGDAVLLDLLYGHPFADYLITESTEEGRLIFESTNLCPGPQAVRNRRRILADELDRAAGDYPGCSVLSVACGHLRELDFSNAIRNQGFSRFIAYDQDGESLREVETQFGQYGVECMKANVKRLLLTPEAWKGSFDFIYTAGLYDYLPANFAARLTASLFRMLKPGGRVLIANFLIGVQDAAYLESVMDWWLLYRTRDEIRAFFEECPLEEMGATRMFEDATGEIAFIEAFRK